VGEKHAEYVQTLVALAELKRRQGSTADALLLFKESADVLQHQDPTFSASEESSHLVMSLLKESPVLVYLHTLSWSCLCLCSERLMLWCTYTSWWQNTNRWYFTIVYVSVLACQLQQKKRRCPVVSRQRTAVHATAG
jgi:hypothetical protein